MNAGEITKSKKHEKHGERTENNLSCAVMLQSADEHEEGENTPKKQVPGNGYLAAVLNAGLGKGIGPDKDERPPEKAVSGEGSTGKGVALAELTDTGDNLSKTAESDTHCNDNDGKGQEACVMQVEKNGSHTEAKEAERAGIGHFVFSFNGHGFSSKYFFLIKLVDYTGNIQKNQ